MRADAPLQELVTQFLSEDLDEVRILDVGAGPLTILGKVWGDRRVHIDAADALAERYEPSLAEAGIVPLVPTQQCFSESLTNSFAEGSYDLTFARNTLDHSLDPVEALREMCLVTRPGGVILCQHAENEGASEEYVGLHGWNFSYEDESLVVWNTERREDCLLYTSPSPRDRTRSRMPSSA